MATNLGLDDQLIEQAQKIWKHRTKKDAVTAALQEYVKRGRRMMILEMEGKIDWDPTYDHKVLRRGKRN